MNTSEMTREQISALADGELGEPEVDIALAALRQNEGKSDWNLYHRIGDVLRSDDMAFDLSPGFSASFAARLEAEPTIIAPLASMPSTSHEAVRVDTQSMNVARAGQRRWAVPGVLAAAAMAATAFVATPQLLVALQGDAEGHVAAPAVVAAAPVPGAGAATSATGLAAVPVVATTAPEGVVLRDARIDDYLLAHQRFSPSVYSSAQYARSATFTTDSNK